MTPRQLKYRAFLSYSHRDRRVAEKVHARLERFRIDGELRGRVTAMGPIPDTLRPIFRDRNDFDAGGPLNDLTVAALDDSAALVVIASPNAAASRYVDEEVRLFRSRHPDRPIIPLIVAGTPGDPDLECFPASLSTLPNVDGAATTMLAADLREEGDGFLLALAKVVARMIGLSPDDVYRRAQRERRRQARTWMAVAAVILTLACFGGYAFWQSQRRAETLSDIESLVERYSVVESARAATPGNGEALKRALTAIAEGAATDPRYAKALELLKAGKPADAEPLLKSVAEDKARRAENDAKDSAKAYRTLASIAAVSDPAHAREYYAAAARLDPSDIDGMLQDGIFEQDAGELDGAEAAYRRVVELGKSDASAAHEVYWARLGLGDVQVTRGNLGAALTRYRDAAKAIEPLAASDPGNADWQRDLSESYNRVGNVQVRQGNLADALKSYRSDLAIAERLAASDPGNAGWRRDLSVSYDRVGDVQVAQGNLADALKSYHSSLAIRERLSAFDPGNAGWQRDLSVSFNKLGNVQVGQGNLADALKSYRSGLAIAERLAASDPGNAGWQRDLSVSYDRVGDVQVGQGNLADALKSYQSGLVIAEHLAASDPGNAGWQRDLSVSFNKVGDVQVGQGNLADALKSYQSSLAIRERLAASDPGNAGWQRDLSVSYDKVGDVQVGQGNLADALKSYQSSLGIRERLAAGDPGNAGWQRDLSVSYAKLAAFYLQDCRPREARDVLNAGRAIIARLVAQFPGWVQWEQDLAWFDQQLKGPP